MCAGRRDIVGGAARLGWVSLYDWRASAPASIASAQRSEPPSYLLRGAKTGYLTVAKIREQRE
jgi:hypothetical protein